MRAFRKAGIVPRSRRPMLLDTTEIDDPMNSKPAVCGARPLKDRLGDVHLCVAPATLHANLESSCARGLPQIPCLPAHDLELVICAGGPSLRRSLFDIRRRIAAGAHVIAVNAASGYLIEHRIIPRAVVLLDPQALLADEFAADPHITYLVASQCHPTVFDKLAGCNVSIWHAHDDEPELAIIRRYYPDPVIIGGGTTAALRTVGIGHAMGFRSEHFYGLDGSFEADVNGWLQHHAYQQPNDDVPEVIEIIARDDDGTERRFLTRQDYARQADEFMDVLKVYHQVWKMGRSERLRVQVHGDGLIPYIWR